MPDRQCVGCKQQEEFGCKARKVRETLPGEDERDTWENPSWLPLEIDGEEVYNCPRQGLLEDPYYWKTMLKYYSMYKGGFLPQSGAVSDQSNRAIELFRLLDEVNAHCDKEQMDEILRKKGDPHKDRR